jgi:hypothetical protein
MKISQVRSINPFAAKLGFGRTPLLTVKKVPATPEIKKIPRIIRGLPPSLVQKLKTSAEEPGKIKPQSQVHLINDEAPGPSDPAKKKVVKICVPNSKRKIIRFVRDGKTFIKFLDKDGVRFLAWFFLGFLINDFVFYF